jgi:phenolic acid decarboxylase
MACTYEVSLKGCKLANSAGLHAVDQLVWVNRKNRKAMYKVVWTSPNTRQVGLQIAESEKLIWDDELVGKLS